jgi:hypothetical protein
LLGAMWPVRFFSPFGNFWLNSVVLKARTSRQ